MTLSGRRGESSMAQSAAELEVFRAFVRVCPLSIEPMSVTKRDPPYADIHCELRDGAELAFELVEVVDRDLAHQTSLQLELKNHYEEYPEKKLPDPDRLRVNTALGNASLAFSFHEHVTERRRKDIAGDLFPLLMDVPPDFVGDINAEDLCEPAASVVRRISIRRGGYCGPLFEFPSTVAFGEAASEAIRGKFGKVYETVPSIELLAYYALQPEPRTGKLPDSLCAFIRDNIKSSPFSRVWFFFPETGRVLAFPE